MLRDMSLSNSSLGFSSFLVDNCSGKPAAPLCHNHNERRKDKEGLTTVRYSKEEKNLTSHEFDNACILYDRSYFGPLLTKTIPIK